MLNARILMLMSVTLTIAGCVTFPSQGPRVSDIQEEYAAADGMGFELINVTDSTINALNRPSGDGLLVTFGDYQPSPDSKIGIGDSLAFNIWEVGQNSMFSPGGGGGLSNLSGLGSAGGNASTIPVQTVGRDGRVTVPYLGQVQVLNRTPFEVQTVIAEALQGISVEPQVLVRIVGRASSIITVVGEVITGSVIPLDERRLRLLEVIAMAGGVKAPIHEVFVQLTRNEVVAQIPLKQILENPLENIQMHPGDVLAVLHRPRSYTIFGAVGRNSQITFDTPHVNLVEALARSGGLVDPLSDPKGVFLLRYESPKVVDLLVENRRATIKAEGVPVVYQIDLSQANSYFTARSFQVEDKDIIYVSSASSTELQKFLMLVGLVSQPVLTGASIDNLLND